jgi:hypothetical protein
MEIDLKALRKSGLYVDEFMFLALINEGEDPIMDGYHWPSGMMERMEQGMWVKYCEDTIELRSKAKELFTPKNPVVNFDEFWEVFPITTPSGRVLRAAKKMWGDKPTRDYEVCKKKYLSKVKAVETHNKIVSIINARVNSKDYEYMNNIETYINQQKWQQDIKYLNYQPIVGKVNKMS